jgi:hypothetical protein
LIALAFLLAATSHCADPNFCPTRDELKAAVDDRIDADIIEMFNALNASDPGSVWVGAPYRVLSVSNVFCGAPFEGPPKSVNCKLTLGYRHRKSHMIVRLEQASNVWRVQEQLEVIEDDDAVRDARLPF